MSSSSNNNLTMDEKANRPQHLDINRKSSFEDSPSPLPSPAIATTPRPKPKVSASMIIPIWITLSSAVIIYNNYVYNTLNFRYPVFTVTWHLFFAAIGTRVLHRTTPLLDGLKDINMTKDLFLKSILPIGFLFSGSLILSNTAYLYLSVSYIQMLKVSLFVSCVALTSQGELGFSMFGFCVQAAAVAFEASRLVMIQILLHGLKMDPLVSLHYYAPVCALLNLFTLPFTEGLAPFYELAQLGPVVLITNAAVAFLLNIAAVFLVGVGSGLVLTLAGVFKDILLITGSVVIFGATVTRMQVVGYSIALAGLVMFKTSGSK
ncbi:hypothetical protein D9758_011429 [Tetrapyrgos nigripes]|uniref:Sugar phosphate transporter domain-containing protein n=1 Tax=Tetrapyrgos nigripes TaxID=182062 RepID=A0A8H5FRC9_9AGAR|nr:hypothetical protein D9758_011429 [Tetrapyrgos nigripes]